ncbi:MAG: substrate-binding domain-containing protein [Polyangiaceae bacterium]
MATGLASFRSESAGNISVDPLTDRGSYAESRDDLSCAPRVLVVLETMSGWSRGTLRGFMGLAHSHAWTVLHSRPDDDLSCMMEQWRPTVAVIGPELGERTIAALAPAALISVNCDRSSTGISSICLDDAAIARLAAEHLVGTGLKQVTTLRFDESSFAVARGQAFEARARALQALLVDGWDGRGVRRAKTRGNAASDVVSWLRALPRPCGIFTTTDSWGRTVARYAQLAGLRVPEDIALIGVDNDTLECELSAPPLSSVLVPWREVGERAAELVQAVLARNAQPVTRFVISPLTVVARRSSDVLAVDDCLVAEAVGWIRANADQRLSVGMVVRGVNSGRQRLERAFRRVLKRTIQEEIRRSHVAVARRLLETTSRELSEIAQRSGFTNATLLNLAFQRELGVAPGAYRRRMLKALSDVAE